MLHTNGDVLGDEGRKALNSCVKVKIYGRPDNLQKKVWQESLNRLERCYAGEYPKGYLLRDNRSFDDILKSREDGTSRKQEKLYDIIDIHDALVAFDNLLYVEKYPNSGPRYDEWEVLIDKRRAEVEREWKEAADNPDKQCQYSWIVAQRRVRDCFAGSFAADSGLLKDDLKCDPNTLYNIIDIHDAVFHWEEEFFFYHNRRYDEYFNSNYLLNWWKEPNPKRDDIERELKEAQDVKDCTNDKMFREYSRAEAEKRVKDCYDCSASESYFPPGVDVLPIKRDSSGKVTQIYNIFDIDKALRHLDEKKVLQKYPEDGGAGCDELKESIDASRCGVEKEYQEARRVLHEYSKSEVEQRVRSCFVSPSPLDTRAIFPIREDEVRKPKDNQTYDIFDIHRVVRDFDKCVRHETMSHDNSKPSEPSELEKGAQTQKNAVFKEYQKAKKQLNKYSWNEAEHRIRDCFAGPFPGDSNIFSTKEEKDGIPKTWQTYDIFEIKNAIDHFDVKKFRERFLADGDPESKSRNERAVKERAEIEEEFAKATKKIELEHGSGFIIHDHFVITNKHVIEDVLNDQSKKAKTEIQRYSQSETELRVKDVVNDTTNKNDDTKEICISNAVIGEPLPCEVIHHDPGKDLALLYCRELNLQENGICPLQLSNHSLLPGMQIFAFGFPMSHTEETALFVTGHVSGSKRTLSGHTLAVLNCSLNSGNSGGPILCWSGGQLNVVGVATQKHFKEILTLEERAKIEKIRESLQTSSIPSVPDAAIERTLQQRGMGPFYSSISLSDDPRQTPMFLLTLKLYDALETHSQFNLSNALPGRYIVEFIKECHSKCSGEGKEKLAEVVNWSEPEHVNISPTGHSEDKKM